MKLELNIKKVVSGSVCGLILFCVLLACAPFARAQQTPPSTPIPPLPPKHEKPGKPARVSTRSTERKTAAAPNVVVSVELDSGNISVQGWAENQVRAQVSGEVELTLQRDDEDDPNSPATRLEVIVAEMDEQSHGDAGRPHGSGDLILNVPRGATVYLKTMDGDVEIENVAEAQVRVTSGRVAARAVTRAADLNSTEGDVSIEDSSGRLRLMALSGDIEASGIKEAAPSDFLFAQSYSGDISLEDIAPAKVEATTISGFIHFKGVLARGGAYNFKTISGEIALMLPATASFKLNARVARVGEIITDFALKQIGTHQARQGSAVHGGILAGSYGAGDASITLQSFSGTLRLRKQ